MDLYPKLVLLPAEALNRGTLEFRLRSQLLDYSQFKQHYGSLPCKYLTCCTR